VLAALSMTTAGQPWPARTRYFGRRLTGENIAGNY